ncbi:SDR family oxidoreductase [Methanolobus sp. ZRKC5]|uniref:SDR family oxidoreductase n=1 Tax=unclassified Methanolobus TaxID=2629569 RepID=UPI00313B254A
MKVLIIGASGLVGNTIYNEFSKNSKYEVYGTYYSYECDNLFYLDMTNKSDVDTIINSVNPDIIIHPAANPNVEYCEQNPEETWNVNVEGSRNLIEAAKNNESKFIFFSSDYVFDGNNGPYTETDLPNPINEYGKQKLAVEKLIEEILTDFLIIRITVVYGWEHRGKNFTMGLIEKLKNGKGMNVPHDQLGSPTYVNNMVQAVKILIENDKKGMYNVVGTDTIDRYRFAQNVAKVFDLDESLLTPISTDNLSQKAKRPLKAGMKVDKIQKELSVNLMSVIEGLEAMKQNRMEGQYENSGTNSK